MGCLLMGYLPLSNWDPNTLQGHNRPELFTQKLLPALVGIQVVGWKRPRPFCRLCLKRRGAPQKCDPSLRCWRNLFWRTAYRSRAFLERNSILPGAHSLRLRFD